MSKPDKYKVSVRISKTVPAHRTADAKAAARAILGNMKNDAAMKKYDIEEDSLEFELVEENETTE